MLLRVLPCCLVTRIFSNFGCWLRWDAPPLARRAALGSYIYKGPPTLTLPQTLELWARYLKLQLNKAKAEPPSHSLSPLCFGRLHSVLLLIVCVPGGKWGSRYRKCQKLNTPCAPTLIRPDKTVLEDFPQKGKPEALCPLDCEAEN